MRSILVLIAVAAAGAWVAIRHLPATEAQAAQPQVRIQEVQSVAIDGGRGLPLAALRARLTTRPGQLLDGDQLADDRLALETELSTRGYLAAHVEPAAVAFDARGGAFVTFQIAQGPVFKLRTVTVIGASERDAGVVTLGAGDRRAPTASSAPASRSPTTSPGAASRAR